jgi:ribosomal protein S18 acetylase RimI-like enzyme
MSGSHECDVAARIKVRTFRHEDQHAVLDLYDHGLLAGQIAPNDTGADIDNVEEAYLRDEGNHFWIAELDGKVVGMIGVAKEDHHLAEIRRLRVARDLQTHGVASILLDTALAHCKKFGYLKIVLDTRLSTQSDAITFLDRAGFQHTRTKNTQGKEVLEFYLDLYRKPEQPNNG